MFRYSIKSHRRIIHDEGCYHLASTRSDDIWTVKSLSRLFDSGFTMCKCCNPLKKMLQAEEDQLIAFCAENGLSYEFHGDSIAITTPHSEWRIALAGNSPKTVLYHRNTLDGRVSSSAYMSGYHMQNVCYYSLLPYFEYIFKHDSFRIRNPIHAGQKKEPPHKGTKRYRKMLAKKKKAERREGAKAVLALIESLR